MPTCYIYDCHSFLRPLPLSVRKSYRERKLLLQWVGSGLSVCERELKVQGPMHLSRYVWQKLEKELAEAAISFTNEIAAAQKTALALRETLSAALAEAEVLRQKLAEEQNRALLKTRGVLLRSVEDFLMLRVLEAYLAAPSGTAARNTRECSKPWSDWMRRNTFNACTYQLNKFLSSDDFYSLPLPAFSELLQQPFIFDI